MPVASADLDAFAGEIRRLAGQGEPPLYPAYRELLQAAYPPEYTVDSLLREPGAGFPDFTVSLGARLANWVEVKHPGVAVDPLPAADAARFDRYREALPHIVLTNGITWRLFEDGEETARVDLPAAWLTATATLTPDQERALVTFLERVTALRPSAARTYPEAVHLLAASARLIERAVIDADAAGLPDALAQARSSFTELLRTNPEDPSEISLEDFADALAQVCTFGYLLARVEAGHDVKPATALDALSATEHPFLKAALHAVIAPDPDLETALGGVLRTACDAVSAAAPRLAGPRGDWQRVPYVYEDFFNEFRPEDRFRFGVFYTPEEITRFQVQEIRRKLVDELGLAGLTDPRVRFLEPACGTGTYLLALAEEAKAEAEERGMPVGATLTELFRDRVVGFEVSPGPSAVAQARLTAWLRDHGISLGRRFPVYTVNTLAPPAAGAHGGAFPSLWAESISHEQEAGDEIKRDTPVLVVFGNPPWGDRPRATFRTGPRQQDNWIEEWARGTTAAVINLYDLYVAFWRFAFHILLERPIQEPRGVVSYITNRSWLRGRAYDGMRRWLRGQGVNAEIVDLGGDIRAGARGDDEPVFAIKAGSAIATLTFSEQDEADATVSFRRLRGTREEKLTALERGALPAATAVSGAGRDPFGTIDWGPLAEAEPITKFFAHNFPGVKTHRDDLVIAVTRDELVSKLNAWNALTGDRRREVFKESRDRSSPDSHTLDPGAIIRHRYRPLDDRFLYGQRSFIDQPGRIFGYYEASPATVCLISMDTRTSEGPVVIATSTLPGYNSFRGSYETHAFPLSVDEEGRFGLGDDDALSEGAKAWAASHGASAADVGAYILALGNAPSYAETFAEALETELVRFPATEETELFEEVAEVGHRLLQAWSLGAPPLGAWRQVAPGHPLGEAYMDGDAIQFANGDRLEGIHPLTFELSVSGYPVMERYLEVRASLELTVELSEEIQKVAAAIAVILDERPVSDALLERAIAAPMMALAPQPTAA